MLYCLGIAIGASICEMLKLNVRRGEMSCKAILVYEIWLIYPWQSANCLGV